ncbi:MAG: hypothetical protein JW966_01100 [Anaerolineae bacterium]|nr:hypothetical protein [Anaerolineae bacterium]
MHNKPFALAVLGTSLLLAALVLLGDRSPMPPVGAQEPDLPPPTAAGVWDYITTQNPYTAWGTWPADRWTDFEGVFESAMPYSTTVRLFVNAIALDAAHVDSTLPAGSMLVLESYGGPVDAPGDMASISVMFKVPGYDPANGDWFWLQTSPDGADVAFEGREPLCSGCHSQPGHVDRMLRYAFGDEPAVTSGLPLPVAEASTVLDYVLNVDPYTTWATWPENETNGFLAGVGEAHGETVRITVHERAQRAAARDSFDGEFPNGSLIVMENYAGIVDEPGDLVALAIMYKVDGFDPAGGDWLWITTDIDEGEHTIGAAGALEGCLRCHGRGDNVDFLLRYDALQAAPARAIDAEALVNQECALCHPMTTVDTAPYTTVEEWGPVIDRQIGYGANLDDEERDAVVEYLANRSQ